MLVIRILDFIVKMFSEFIYFVAYCIALMGRKVCEYHVLIVFGIVSTVLVWGSVFIYMFKTN